MSVWERGRTAAPTRTVTGAILAPHETQRRVASSRTGIDSSATPGKSQRVPLDPGGEMVTLLCAVLPRSKQENTLTSHGPKAQSKSIKRVALTGSPLQKLSKLLYIHRSLPDCVLQHFARSTSLTV